MGGYHVAAMTKLTVAIMVHGLEQALADAARAAERGADLVEFRLDQFTDDADAAVDLVMRSPVPCIATIRPTWEGGLYDGDESARQALMQLLAEATRPPVYIDLELAAYQRQAITPPGDGLILSSHDFQGRPRDLLQRVAAMAEAPECRVMKLAWAARSLRDNIEAFELIAAAHKPTIALCMGEFGQPSRILAKKFGALLTFASLEPGEGTAPGQVSVEQMKRLYRWDAITPGTKVYGVMGWPVGHSMSPAIHNAGFDATGFDGVYLPMPIPPQYEHFKATMISWLDYKPLDFRGASVTIPHKQNLLRFVAEQGGTIEPLAARIGAANTLTVANDGSLHASNTDYAAALDAVCDAMDITREDLAGRRVGVIGAGGAARAIVAAFAHYGATIVVYNRTPGKAEELAANFNGHIGKVVAAPLDHLPKSCCEIFINCTPIGMHPNVDASPIATWPACADESTVVFDTIYNPIETKLLREAAQRGCTTISGLEMFTRQAAAQFQQWTSQPAPMDVFDQVVRERLGHTGR